MAEKKQKAPPTGPAGVKAALAAAGASSRATDLVEVLVAPGHVVKCAETHRAVREGGVAKVPREQYTPNMGKLVAAEPAPAGDKPPAGGAATSTPAS